MPTNTHKENGSVARMWRCVPTTNRLTNCTCLAYGGIKGAECLHICLRHGDDIRVYGSFIVHLTLFKIKKYEEGTVAKLGRCPDLNRDLSRFKMSLLIRSWPSSADGIA